MTRFPKQGGLFGVSGSVRGQAARCIRDDQDEPWLTILRMFDGRTIDADVVEFEVDPIDLEMVQI